MLDGLELVISRPENIITARTTSSSVYSEADSDRYDP